VEEKKGLQPIRQEGVARAERAKEIGGNSQGTLIPVIGSKKIRRARREVVSGKRHESAGRTARCNRNTNTVG